MLTKQQAARIKRAAKRLAEAEVQYAWRGAGDPDDIDGIEQERRDARKNLNRTLAEFTLPASMTIEEQRQAGERYVAQLPSTAGGAR